MSLVFRTRAARGRSGSHGHGRGQALGQLDRARYRFHRQADRRDSTQSPTIRSALTSTWATRSCAPRYREGLDHQAAPLDPSDIVPITITLYPTANVFKKGHRIRVDVSSSNYPRFDVNPNTSDPLGDYRRMVPADNTIYHEAGHPSQVILPVVPKSP